MAVFYVANSWQLKLVPGRNMVDLPHHTDLLSKVRAVVTEMGQR